MNQALKFYSFLAGDNGLASGGGTRVRWCDNAEPASRHGRDKGISLRRLAWDDGRVLPRFDDEPRGSLSSSLTLLAQELPLGRGDPSE